MAHLLRRLPLSRLLLLCGLVVVIGVSLTALAFALGTGPTPPPTPLADAVHNALTARAGGDPIQGVSANVQLTDHLLEGANLASGDGGSGGEGDLASNPLLSGGSGRLWISNDGRVRLELQAEGGDTEVIYDGHTLTVYDASSNTVYHFTPPADESVKTHGSAGAQEVPSVAKIEEALAKLEHVTVSGATPTDIAGQPAYTVRISPKEGGSLLGGAELSWDANNGVPLRTAVYSSSSSAPVIELAASSISYGPVPASVFEITPPSSAKVEEIVLSKHDGAKQPDGSHAADRPKVTTHGSGVTAVEVLESNSKPGSKPLELPEQLPKVKIGDSSAAELSTALGTLLGFERSGVRYLLVGSVTPAQIEAVARGL